MRKVQLYVENQLVDLFDDEQIKVDSSIQNINDISKVFTDFSQTFTVPASKNNNAIFDHYYNNDLDGTYQAQTRVNARLEINHARFREGKLQLEGAEIKDNKASHYKVTFYGDVVSLKDKFGDDKLSDLDYSGISHEYTGANVSTAITSPTDLDVRYPLISSSRVWTYGDTPATTDIGDTSSDIDYTELFPALKDDVILDAIEAQYGVTFSGLFRTEDRFQKSFTWWKNRTTTNFTNTPHDVLFNVGGTNEPLADSVCHVNYISAADCGAPDPSYSLVDTSRFVRIYLIPSFTGEYKIWRYNNGTPWGSPITWQGTAGVGKLHVLLNYANFTNNTNLDDNLTVKITTSQSGTMDGNIQHLFNYNYTNDGVTFTNGTLTEQEDISTITFDNYIDFNSSAPDIKVADWFSGLLKQFNCVIYPLSDALTYQFEPLEDWYAAGAVVNITPYVDTKSIKIDRLSLHKEINFTWEKSKAFLNEAYEEINGKKYGELKNTFPYDGNKFEVKLPYENLLFSKFSGENLQVSYCLDKAPNYKPYIPKPVKLYLYETTTCDFWLNTGTSDNIISYMPMGQDAEVNNENYSINWGNEQSSLLEVGVDNSLYQIYYQPFLTNLFNPKSRKVTLKAQLPLPMLTALTLDDKVIVRDKAYRINNMKTNLSTGVVDLVLVSDWIKERTTLPPITPVGDASTSLTVLLRPTKPLEGGTVKVDSITGDGFVTHDGTLPLTYSVDTLFTFTIPRNTGATRTDTVKIIYYDGDGNVLKTEYFPITQNAPISYLLTEASGFILTESLNRLILE